MSKRILIFLFFLLILIKVPFLDQVFLLHDERDIVMSGYSIAKTGKDLYEKNLPLSFEAISPNNPLLAIYYSAFWSLFTAKSVFFARLPFAIVSSFLIFLIFEIIMALSNDKTKSILTTIIFCFSPWIFHLSRLALDIPLAVVFLTLGIFLYLKKKTFFSYLFFLFSLFTYQGFRLLVPFLLIYLEIHFYLSEKNLVNLLRKSFKNVLFVLFMIWLVFIIEPQINKNRMNEIIFFNEQNNAQEVILRRSTSLAPTAVKRAFSNKLTVPIDYILSNLAQSFNVSFLFKKGDNSAINGNAISGQFFFVFIVFYFLGIAYFGKKLNSNDLYIVGLVPIGVIPSLLSVHGSSFAIRGILSGVGFSYLITLGLLQAHSLIKNSKYKKIIIACFIFIFALNLLVFLYGYFLRRPITVGEIFNENEKQLASYILKYDKKKFTLYHDYPKDVYLSLAFIAGESELPIKQIQTNLKKGKDYTWRNYSFKLCDNKLDYFAKKNVIVSEKCLDEKVYNRVVELADAGKIKVDRIFYRDASLKTAYFIIE